MKALIVLSALKRKCGCSCARRLCSWDSTSRRSRSVVRSASACASLRAALHLLCIVPRERDAGDHGVDRQVRIQAIEKERRRGRQARLPRRHRDVRRRRIVAVGEDDAERHVQSQPDGKRRGRGEAAVEPEHEGRDESPRIPARQRPGQSASPGQSREVQLRGKDDGDGRPEQEHPEADRQPAARAMPGGRCRNRSRKGGSGRQPDGYFRPFLTRRPVRWRSFGHSRRLSALTVVCHSIPIEGRSCAHPNSHGARTLANTRLSPYHELRESAQGLP